MEITRQVLVLDAGDVAEVSTFWAALLGGQVVHVGWGQLTHEQLAHYLAEKPPSAP